jgi:hypothetical protein
MRQAFCHLDGAVAILDVRRRHDPSNARNLTCDRLVRRQVVRGVRYRNMDVPDWLEDGVLFGESGISLELDRWESRLCIIQHKWQSLSASLRAGRVGEASTFVALIERPIEEANDLDRQMLLWASELGPEWCCQVHLVIDERLHDSPSGSVVHTYTSISHASLINRFRSLRIDLKSLTIRLLGMLEARCDCNVEPSIRIAITAVQTLFYQICASVPFFVGQTVLEHSTADGCYISLKTHDEDTHKDNASIMSRLAPPLFSILKSFDVSELSYAQQQWTRNLLIRVGQVNGYRLIEMMAIS